MTQDHRSVGVFFYASDTNRFLYLLRNDDRTIGSWGLPGGKVEINETLFDGAERECLEEMQFFPNPAKLVPIQKFVNNSFAYHTFFCKVENEFIPKLNREHLGYCWVDSESYPRPLHPGLFNMVSFEIVQKKLKALIKKAA